jgi:hypothetical protein
MVGLERAAVVDLRQQTAKLNGIDPQAWLTWVLEERSYLQVDSDRDRAARSFFTGANWRQGVAQSLQLLVQDLCG